MRRGEKHLCVGLIGMHEKRQFLRNARLDIAALPSSNVPEIAREFVRLGLQLTCGWT
jgi:hypothetical protein